MLSSAYTLHLSLPLCIGVPGKASAIRVNSPTLACGGNNGELLLNLSFQLIDEASMSNKPFVALAICAVAGGASFALYQQSNEPPDVVLTTPTQQIEPVIAASHASKQTTLPDVAVQPASIEQHANITELDQGDITVAANDTAPYFFVAQKPHENGEGTFFLPPPDARIEIKNEQDAKRLITEGGAEHFNLGENDDVAIMSSKRDQLGNTFYKYKQTYKGIPVDGRELVVEANDENTSSMLAGFFESNINVETTPSLDGQRANSMALEVDSLIVHQQPELQIHVTTGQPTLVYRSIVQYNSEETGLHLDEIFVDANDGTVISTINLIHTGLSRSLYTKNDGCIRSTNELPGSYLFGERGPSGSTDPYAQDAYKNIGIAYQFYKHLWNRDSLDGKGMALKATVRVKIDQGQGCQGDNAFFMGAPHNIMVFASDGTRLKNVAGALDITAHELTHGVTSTESQLKYENESGAINEALSDIFGSGAEAWSDSGGSANGSPAGGIKPNTNTWTIGEKAAQSNEMKRRLYSPTLDGQSKDNYTDRGTCGSSSNCPDNGYVHTNSGIMNLAFYLLSEGGKHPRGKTSNQVTGIGMEKALRIYYHSATNTFTSTTGFQTARTLLAKSAESLYGKCSAEWTAVNESYDAVKVPGYWTKCGDTGGGDTGGGDTGGTGGKGCATESLTQNLNKGSQIQQSMRSFRDETLNESDAGKRMEDLYYKHSDELKEMMKKDWILKMTGLRLLFRATYAFNPKQIENDIVPLDYGHGRLVMAFINRANSKASAELKADVDEMKTIVEQLQGLTAKALMEKIKTL